MRRVALVLTCLCLLLPRAAWAQGLDAGTPPPGLAGVSFDQNLNTPLPLDLEFVDEEGRPVRLGQFFEDDKPAILTLVYYECPMLCTLVLNGLVRGMNPLRFSAGEEFRVVTVSIDPGEGPELARRKKDEYLRLYGRESAREGWSFLSGPEESIAKLAEAVGFGYVYDPETDLYRHASGIVVVTPQGRTSHYLLGIDYAPFDLRLAIVEASQGRIGSAVDHILLYCFAYDPSLGKYSVAVMNLMRLGGLLTMGFLGAFMLRNFFKDRSGKNDPVGKGTARS